MDTFNGSDEEDNNPFSGTTHLYASGIAAVTEGQDDYDFVEQMGNVSLNGNGNGNGKSNGLHNADMVDTIEEDIDDASPVWQHSHVNSSSDKLMTDEYMKISDSTLANGSKEGAIRVVDAGQYRDSYGKYAIGYKIEYRDHTVTRRYSEFDSLRQSLCRLLPTIIIPPIPSKHPIIKYLFNPLHAEKDIKIIEKRQRMLTRFLNNCFRVEEIRNHVVFQKFLNPEYIWKEVLNSPPISILPINNLFAPPLIPTKPSPLHLLLPTPSVLTLKRQEQLITEGDEQEIKFNDFEVVLKNYQKILQPLNKTGRQTRSHIQACSTVLSELGAYFNAFSLENNVLQITNFLAQINLLSTGIEKIGQAIDVNYVSAELLSEGIMTIFEERTKEMIQFTKEAFRVLQFRHYKQEQYHIIETTINKRRDRIQKLKDADQQVVRLEEALKLNAEESPTVAHAMESLSQRATTKNSEKQIMGLFKQSPTSNGKSMSDSIRRDIEPHLLSQEERNSEVLRLEKEIEKLNECYKLIEKDLEQINQSMAKSLVHLQVHFRETWKLILLDLSHLIVSWLTDCSRTWKNAQQAINSI